MESTFEYTVPMVALAEAPMPLRDVKVTAGADVYPLPPLVIVTPVTCPAFAGGGPNVAEPVGCVAVVPVPVVRDTVGVLV